MKMTYDHFNGSIPQDIRERIGRIAEIVYEDLIGDLQRGENFACPNMDHIYGYDPGGFIPFQHGGFQVTELYRHDIDSSYHITEGQSEAAQKHEKYLYDCFASDHKEELKAAGIDTEADDFNSESYSIPESLENEFSDYESEFWEPVLLRFCVFISKPDNDIWGDTKGPRTIELSLSLNYSDAPYYREKHDDDTLAILSLTMDEFLGMEPEVIVSGFKERIEDFWKKEKAAT